MIDLLTLFSVLFIGGQTSKVSFPRRPRVTAKLLTAASGFPRTEGHTRNMKRRIIAFAVGLALLFCAGVILTGIPAEMERGIHRGPGRVAAALAPLAVGFAVNAGASILCLRYALRRRPDASSENDADG